jgi:hypothetical protein
MSAADKVHCRLTGWQKAHNATNATLAGAASGALSALTAGLPLAAQAATAFTPVPLDWLVPVPGKNAYYLGYLHDTSLCVSAEGRDPRATVLGARRRGAADDAGNGCFVWSTLTYLGANTVRVVVFGGGKARRVFEVDGALTTWLEVAEGQLTFNLKGVQPPSIRVPVHHMDQVLYVSCGERPLQAKWHVTVSGGVPTSVVLKRKERSTGAQGVLMHDKAAIMRAALAAGVWPDGSVSRFRPDDDGVHATLVRFVRALDPERLNPFTNRALVGQRRLEQPYPAEPAKISF